MWVKTSGPHCIASALGLCLAVAGSPALGTEHGFDGIYSGKRVLTKGSAGPNCAEEDTVSITIHGQTLTFSGSTLRDFTEPFYPKSDGSFGQIYTGEGGPARYHGRIIGDSIDVDATGPLCEHHWHLKKAN